MSKSLTALVAGLLGLTAITSPCFALSEKQTYFGNNTETPTITASSPAASPSPSAFLAATPATVSTPSPVSGSASADSRDVLTRTAMLPVRFAAVASALAIGTPIAVARCEARRIGQYGDAMISELNTNQYVTPLMVASVPGQSLRVVGAVGEGLVNSGCNAAKGWEHPFTAESFSLTSLDKLQ